MSNLVDYHMDIIGNRASHMPVQLPVKGAPANASLAYVASSSVGLPSTTVPVKLKSNSPEGLPMLKEQSGK